MNKISIWLVLVSLIAFSGCDLDSKREPEILFVQYTFSEDTEGWEASYADLPVNMEDSFRLSFDHGNFSLTENTTLSAAIQKGYAANNDLFMYIKTQVSGLRPNNSYKVYFDVQFYAPILDVYEGELNPGDPNTGSFFKVGVFQDEPVNDTVLVNDINMVKTRFDKGENNTSGSDMNYIGKIVNTELYEDPEILLVDNNSDPILISADSEGKLWVAMGSDINIPVYQGLYYSSVIIRFEDLSE